MAHASGSVRVLHVDDEPGFADTAARLLERENECFTGEAATSADEGLKRLSEGEFDCVVSDYDMPGQNGIEFLKDVREEYPDLPFILFTGKGSEEVASDAISAGATDYLQKGRGSDQYQLLANRIQNSVEQYRARETVVETRQRLETIAEHTNDVLWQFNADWTEPLFVNSAYEEIWGRTIDELKDQPQSFLEGIEPDDRPSVTAGMERLSAGEPVDIEFRVNVDEDFQRWVWVQAEPTFDEDGEVASIVGFARDITERKQRERELERYEAIVENTEDGIYIFDTDGHLTFVNQRVVDVSGIPRDAWIGKHVSIHTDLGTLTEREVAAIEAGIRTIGQGGDTEARIELRPAIPHDLRDLELRLTPFQGGTTQVIGFSRDITERKERERELRQQNERLEKFTSVVSHDLQNPLQVADGRLELARSECDSEHLDDVANALDRMDALINDLLTIAQEGEQVQETHPVVLSEVVEGCWEGVQTADATLVCDTERTIQADPGRLKQLLENLIRNATDHGGADVTVTVDDTSDGFYVADDGPGIPDDVRDKVFDPGYSTTDQGTGFGLNIVQETAEAHGWEVDVTDSEDGGARFEFSGVERDAS